MDYSKYFGTLVKENGVPQLSESSFKRMMNIAYLEGRKEGLLKAKLMLRPDQGKTMFDLEIMKVNRSITDQTGNIAPNELFDRMLRDLPI